MELIKQQRRLTNQQRHFLRNKKGIFFTVLVIIILSLFLMSYTFYSVAKERKVIQKRIETMNNFLLSIERDLPRQLFISGFRIIFLFEQRILEKQGYIDDIDASFQEAFFNGTIEGQTGSNITILMNGATFPDIVEAINEKSKEINVKINLSNPIVEITQDDPWNVKFILTVNLIMQDEGGLASWNKTEIIVAYVSIEGFEDPTYFLAGSGESNVINRTPYETFNIPSELQDHAENTYYTNNTDAPSFLDRLEGNINVANPNGIESLAVPKLQSFSGRSIVDHEYFSQPPTAGTPCSSPPLPSWFLIDTAHRALYQCT